MKMPRLMFIAREYMGTGATDCIRKICADADQSDEPVVFPWPVDVYQLVDGHWQLLGIPPKPPTRAALNVETMGGPLGATVAGDHTREG